MLRLADPTITVTGSFTTFSTSTGAASGAQALTLSGQGLLDDITITSSATGMEFSTDNQNYSYPKTIFRVGTSIPGQPIVIYVRLSMSAPVGSQTNQTINFASSGAQTVQVLYSSNVTATAPQAQYFFSLGSKTVSGWNNMYFPSGNTTTVDIQSTDASTGWTLKTHHTDWALLYGQYYASNSDGGSDTPDSTYGSAFPSTVVAGTLINGAAFIEMTDGLYPFSWDNLPSGTYQIDIMCSEKLSIIGGPHSADVHIKFGGAADNTYTSGTFPSGTSPILWPFASNTNKVLRFVGTITTGQAIRWGVWRNNGISDFSVVSAVAIKKIG